ncbi:hypothetical protein AAMO2058_001426500 [Amorphochlora amoebiformis]
MADKRLSGKSPSPAPGLATVMMENPDGTMHAVPMSLADVMAALSAQRSVKSKIQGKKEASPPVGINKENTKFVVCSQCNSKILKPGKSRLVKKEIFLHHMALREEDEKQTGEKLSDFWLVTDQFSFENIGVSRKVTSGNLNYKYLACADCDLGPVGIRYMDQPTHFYIAHDRVHYYSKDEAKTKPVESVESKSAKGKKTTSK